MWVRKTSESEPVGKASKQNQGGTKTGASSLLREQPGRYLLTGQAVSGVQEALCQEDAKASCCTKDEGGPFGVAL